MSRMRGGLVTMALAIVVALVDAPAVRAQSGETVGVVTELKVGRGTVQIRSAGATVWRRAGPLAAVRAGDTVRATDDATVVIVLSAGRGTLKIDAPASPFTVPPVGDGGKLDRARDLVRSGVDYLSGASREQPGRVLAVRGAAQTPVVIISPRNGPVLSGTLVFEWTGSPASRYTVLVVGPAGPLFQRSGVTGPRLEHPADAPALTPGKRYSVQVEAGSEAPQEAWFELVDAARERAIRDDLAAIQDALAGDAPPTSVATIKAAVLAREGLVHDARRHVLAALASDPEEPTLHRLLGDLYVQAGLLELGAASHRTAESLLARGAK